MSYLQNYTFQLGDSPSIDAFNRLRVSNQTQIFDGKHSTFSNNLIYADYASGPSASCIWNSSTGMYTLGVSGSGGRAIHRSRYAMYYLTGKSSCLTMSFDNFGGTSSVKRVGYYTNYFDGSDYDILDGLVLENDHGNISFKIYSRGSTASEIFPQSSWSNEYFNPSDIDWDAPQILIIDFEWLSQGRVRFGLIIDGMIRYFVYANHANYPQFTSPYMINPNNFITSEIIGDLSQDSMLVICNSYQIEGSVDSKLGRNFGIGHYSGVGSLTRNVKYAVLGYRLSKDTYRLSGMIDLKNISVATTSTSAYAISVILNPTLSTSTTWTGLTSSNLPVEYSTPATPPTVTGGLEINVSMGNGGSSFDAETRDNLFHPGYTFDTLLPNGVKADEVWICLTPLTANIDSINKIYVSANLFLESQ